jgi:phage shock protein E
VYEWDLPYHVKTFEQHLVRGSTGWFAVEFVSEGITKKRKYMSIERIIKERQGTIVDVRTPAEYEGDSVKGSINIPLQEVQERMQEVKNLRQPLVLCCASGARSGAAHRYLSKQGIECANGGSWKDIHQLQSQTV